MQGNACKVKNTPISDQLSANRKLLYDRQQPVQVEVLRRVTIIDAQPLRGNSEKYYHVEITLWPFCLRKFIETVNEYSLDFNKLQNIPSEVAY